MRLQRWAYGMDEDPCDILPPVPDKRHQRQIVAHPEPHRVAIGVEQVLQVGVISRRLTRVEEAPEHGPAARVAVLVFVT